MALHLPAEKFIPLLVSPVGVWLLFNIIQLPIHGVVIEYGFLVLQESSVC